MEDADMKTLARGLVVDDKPAVIRQVQDILDYGFSQLGEWEVEYEEASTPAEAVKLAREVDFDFAVLDFDLNDETCLPVVKELRKRRKDNCYILVVTGESKKNPNFLKRSMGAGADDAIIRDNHLTMSPAFEGDRNGWDGENLARRIRERMRVQDREDGFRIVFAPEAGVQSMLHSLGDPPGEYRDAMRRGELIARTLIVKCLGTDDDTGTSLTVQHLAPGRSGAHVCKVVRVQPGQPTESFVLKIGLDRASLAAEKEANSLAARALRSQVLVRLDRELRSHEQSGYSAIAAELAKDAVTLKDWLQQPGTTTEQATKVARELHRGHLKELLQPGLRERQPVSQWLTMSPVLHGRVLEALGTYAQVWRDDRGAGQADAEQMASLLRDFVDTGALPGVAPKRLGEQVLHAGGFGDLHSGNVLVQSVGEPHPLLIDASQYGLHHWATDTTRLLVDLVLQVRRPGIESMLWSGLAAEAGFATGLCDCTGSLEPDPGDPTDAYILNLVTERATYLCLDDLEPRRADWHWQWHVALAREFLRQGSRPGLLPTRAVLALTAAARHLQQAAETLAD
ncbi:response regulator [Micromonospora sp. NPDC005305]|uniref:response regulator n=1 Tax=Micromonospora sp. NPDC005305 TaxID=3156875 RepID=UPI0033AC5DA3